MNTHSLNCAASLCASAKSPGQIFSLMNLIKSLNAITYIKPMVFCTLTPSARIAFSLLFWTPDFDGSSSPPPPPPLSFGLASSVLYRYAALNWNGGYKIRYCSPPAQRLEAFRSPRHAKNRIDEHEKVKTQVYLMNNRCALWSLRDEQLHVYIIGHRNGKLKQLLLSVIKRKKESISS